MEVFGLAVPMERVPFSDGSVKSGHVLDIHERPQLFDSHMWHESEPWVGTDRWVLVAYVPGRFEALGSEQRQALVELGFSVKGLYGLGTGEVSVSQCKASVSSEACDEGQDAVSGPACSEFASSWEVELPCEILDPGQFEQAVSLHHRYVEDCSRIAGELDRAVEWGCGGQVSKLLRVARLECGWFEGVLKRWGPVEEMHTSLKGLTTDIPLGEQELEAAEVFLQTRTVGLDEARKELEKWKGPGQDKVTALEETTGAVERVTVEQVEEWIRAGYKVMQVPGKAVLTRKAGVGRRQLRAVCCGNYLPAESLGLAKSDLYAGGVEALTVRVVLVYVASRPDWCGCILDVKCAFLYAPARSIQEDAEKQTIIVVRPPYLLVQLGLLGPQRRWRIIRALYGLQTSPKDWALYRDQELKGLQVSVEDEVLTLFQGISDDSLWFAKNAKGEVRALVVVYVDDVGLFGPRLVLRALVDKLREKWNTSEPVWSNDETLLNICGVELQQLKMGWRLTKRAYLQELLQRYEVESTASVPIARWDDPPDEDCGISDVRRAQGIVGALLWAMTRSRPDLMFAISKMSQCATKAPKKVFETGLQVLAYVRQTLDLGLEFPIDVGPTFGSHGQLSLPRNKGVLEVYSDSSHAPQGGRSMQSTVLMWRGGCILWEASRQAFTTLSSAESELVSMIHSVQAGESVQPIIEELTEEDTLLSLQGDNAASVRAFEPAGGGWRNRHLRMRAAAARERVAAGALVVQHIAGEYQVADLGTKPLGGSRITALLSLANVREGSMSRGMRDGLNTSARALRRVRACASQPEWLSCPTAALVLTMLAIVQPTRAQPMYQEEKWGWVWIVAFGLVMLAAVIWYGGLGLAVPGSLEARGQVCEESESGSEAPEPNGSLRELCAYEPQGLDDSLKMPGTCVEIGGSCGSNELPTGGLRPVGTVFQGQACGSQDGGSWLDGRALSAVSVLDGPSELAFAAAQAAFEVSQSGSSGLGHGDPFAVVASEAEIAFAAAQAVFEASQPGVLGLGYDPSYVEVDSEGQSEGSERLDAVPHRPSEDYQPPIGFTRQFFREEESSDSASSSSTSEGFEGAEGHVSWEARAVAEQTPGVGDPASSSDFSRFVTTTDGRLVAWRVRDERIHFLRRLLTLSGEVIVGLLGVGSGEVRWLREVAATYRYGIAGACERFRSLENVAPGFVPREGDSDPLEGRADASEPGASETTESSRLSSASSGSEYFSPEGSELEAASEETGVWLTASLGVWYRAGAEGFWMRYVDDVAWVPLPGWSLSQVQVVVEGLCRDDWSEFEAMISAPRDDSSEDWGSDLGSEESCLAVNLWALGCSSVGFLAGVISTMMWVGWIQGWTSVLFCVYLSSFWVRMAALWGDGSIEDGFRRLVILAEESYLWFPLVGKSGIVGLSLPRANSWNFVVLIVLFVVFGFSSPANAQIVMEKALVGYEEIQPEVTAATCEIQETTEALDTSEVSLWWFGLIWSIFSVGVWEAFKWTVKRTICRRKNSTAESQTEDQYVIELPLPSGVPHRAQILFCLWRAGFHIDVQQYPEEVQDEYHSYVGAYLVRVDRGEDSSD